MRLTYGIIGTGKMAKCLARMLSQKGERVVLSTDNCCNFSNSYVAEISNVLFLTLPSNIMKSLSCEIMPYIRDDHYIVSTDHQTSFDYLAHLYQRSHHITRASPTRWCAKGVLTPYLANYDGDTDNVLIGAFGSRSVLRVRDEQTFQLISDFVQIASYDEAKTILNLIYEGKDPKSLLCETV